ncbi:MAG: FG-GAP-like repeat-containing protein, partial [Bacteroidota bacterium]
MKTIFRRLVLLTGYCLAVTALSAQPVQEFNENFFKLNTAITGNKRYKAKNFIHLQPGVRYTPGSQGKLGLQVAPGSAGSAEYSPATENTGTYVRNLDYGKVVGTLPGSWEVGQNGNFSYSIPIPAPAGTAGMRPSLALSYQSSVSNGVLGVGWGIAGLSAIQRTFQTKLPYGKIAGINFDTTDAYALDGSNLIKTGVKQYRTEYQSYRDITFYSDTDTGSHFIVKATDGSSWEYGNSADSKLFGPNGMIFQWKLSKVTDKFGNYTEYHYKTAFATEGCLDYVAYTGNASENLLPYNFIRFNYSVRGDQNTTYRKGKEYVLAALLSSVDVLSDNHKVNSLKLDYLTNDIYSRLQRITLKDSVGNEMSPTVLGWEMGLSSDVPLLDRKQSFAPYFPEEQSANQQIDDHPNLVYGDLDGDGRSEPISFENPAQDEQFNAYVYLSRGDTLLRIQKIRGAAPNASGSMQIIRPFTQVIGAFDFNNDGRDEVYVESKSFIGGTAVLPSGVIQLTYNPANNRMEITDQFPFRFGFFGSNRNDYGIADIDGDGYVDLCGFTLVPAGGGVFTASVVVKLAAENESFGPITFQDITRMETGDFDGDGVDEIWAIRREQITILKPVKQNGTWQLQTVTQLGLSLSILELTTLTVSDFNGDGNSDLMFHSNISGWKCFYSDGVAMRAANSWVPAGIDLNPAPSFVNSTYLFRDFNRDGKTDILQTTWDILGSTTKLFTSRGALASQKYQVREITASHFSGSPKPLLCADVNGDGILELCIKGGGGMISQVSVMAGVRSNTLSSVSNGLGQQW